MVVIERIIEKEKDSHNVLSTHELLLNIFCSLTIKNILRIRLVCKLWNDVLQDDHTWQILFETKYNKVTNPLFLNGLSYKSICLFKEFNENKLWNNVISIIKEPTSSQKPQKYKVFGERVSTNSYMYDILNTNIIENGIAIAFVSQRPLIRIDDVDGGVRVLNEKPTLNNTDFSIVPNLEVEVYLKIIKFNDKEDKYDIRLCDTQRLTVTQEDIGRNVNWIKNMIRLEFGKEYYMYSLDVALGTCKIFSYAREHSICNFNIDTPPICDLSLSNNLLIVRTETGRFQVTTRSVMKDQEHIVDLTDDKKFNIILSDVAIISTHSNSFGSFANNNFKANILTYYLDKNDFMIINYVNTNDEYAFKCLDLRKLANHSSFYEGFDYRKHVVEYSELLPAKAHSFVVRWKNQNNDTYEHYSSFQQQQSDARIPDDLVPEIVVTCSGGLVLIYRPVVQKRNSAFVSRGKIKTKLALMWRISTGLNFCKMIDTSFWTKENFPKNGDWLFLSAKKLKGDMKVPVVLQLLLPNSTNSNSNKKQQEISYGYTRIDGHNPNEERTGLSKDPVTYTRLVYRIISEKIPHTGSIVQLLPLLPHSLLIVCQRKEPDLIRPRPKFTMYIYDYHTSSITPIPQHVTPFFYLLPSGYFCMPNPKDDILFVPLPNLKSRSFNPALSSRFVKPKLVPDGHNKLKVTRGSGNKRVKIPKSAKVEKRKKNQSSKVAYSSKNYDIDYDDYDDDFNIDDYEEYEGTDDYVYDGY
ncbi:13263_t:CDS:2 [Funneliformis geosporum]|uniref:1353_t:CDS:1 n=1 Tax=Funneliformis geosporum TaxID=1117311 RepID=A0A9W4STJ4_9GLOM|nr:13263_t:CDS:2 [Funneliformis geosporum]CAI2182508.1 1353_t:CDS:2 [Funneliformis geosporum]